jgi:hypothetical protein
MIQKWMKSICALALALLFTPLISAEAHDRGRRHQHRRNGTIVFVNNRNPTPGTARRVRRGRNWTPGISRGRVVRRGVIRRDIDGDGDRDRIIRSRRGHGRGHGKH